MLCLLWQTLLSRGAKGLMVVLVPNTLSASKRRSLSTLARTKPPQTMTAVLSRTRAGLCPPCSQWIQYMIFHFSFWAALFWSETSVWLGIFRLLQPILTGRYQGKGHLCIFYGDIHLFHTSQCTMITPSLHRRCSFRAIHLRNSPRGLLPGLCMAYLAPVFHPPLGPRTTSGLSNPFHVSHLIYLPTNFSRTKVLLAGGAMWRLISRWSWKLPKLNSSNLSGKESSYRQHVNQN